MGDGAVLDAMTGALHDPFGNGHMGITAENIAPSSASRASSRTNSRSESHKRAANALEKGYFKDQIVPVELKTRKGVEQFATDEHVRKGVEDRGHAEAEGGVQEGRHGHRGQCLGTQRRGRGHRDDGSEYCKEAGRKPMARLVAYAHAGVDPQVMGLGPIPRRSACSRKPAQASDMDVVESNEAFAAQAMAVTKDLGLDPAKVNPNGGAVALGHPIGATGAILTVKALYELQRTEKRYALVTMCIGGGQGIAAIFERL
jgi:acetyl-CoA C-acetyltransferase